MRHVKGLNFSAVREHAGRLGVVSYPSGLAFFLLVCAAVASWAADVSTYTFANCGFRDTGQTQCFDNAATPAPGACPLGNPGQDGDYSPASLQPRYTVYPGSVTVDDLTGLMWTSTGSNNGVPSTWANALQSCENSTFAGYSDWRLPNIKELAGIADYGAAAGIYAKFFPNTMAGPYWSSTTYPSGTTDAYTVDYSAGVTVFYTPKTSSIYMRCVRGGFPHAAEKSVYSFNSGMNCEGVYRSPDTSTRPYHSGTNGDDSTYQPAVSSPSYTNNSDGTTTDNVTGLMWARGASIISYTWATALSSCTTTMNSGSGYANYTDWRLPNALELLSIADYGVASGPYINNTDFPGTMANYYWTSTTYVPDPKSAIGVGFSSGVSVYDVKTNSFYVRCVRGGW